MAVVSTFLNDTPSQTSKVSSIITRKFTVASGSANNADNIAVHTIPIGVNLRLTEADIKHDATLGASATLKLQVNRGGTRTDLTVATTAGGASHASSGSVATMPFDLQGGDVIEALVGGANITAANVSVDLMVVRS